MTEAFETYSDAFCAETASLIDLFNGLLSGSLTADDAGRQIDQHLNNIDQAADQYFMSNIARIRANCIHNE